MSRTNQWSRTILTAGLSLAFLVPASAQDTTQRMGPGDAMPDKVELSIFGGGSFFNPVDKGLGTKLANGGAFGFRVTENFWKYVGLEQAYTYSVNNMTFQTPHAAGQPTYAFGSRINQLSLNSLFYFTERGSRIRPFLTAGISAMNFDATDNAVAQSRLPQNLRFGAQNVDDVLLPALNYGGGVKFHLTDRFGLRLDVRGLMSKNPAFKLPDTPAFGGVYIPNQGLLHGVQTTAGLSWYFGKKAEPMAVVAKPAPQALGALSGGTLSAGTGALCQGRPITIRAQGVSDPAGRPITYKWRVNGQPMGGNSPELTFTPDREGAYSIELDVEAPNTEGMPVRTAKANTLSINVQPYAAPTISGCQAVPNQLKFGEMANLSANATGSACSTINVNWSASEGTITQPTQAKTQFDSKSVRFEQGGKIQAKTVTVTARVTDDRGASASCDATIKVDYVPSAVRFSDVIFSKNSARVNNCGKRILLEELAPKAADPDYEIVLVGHIDQDEVSKGRTPTTLDMQRVMNAVAVLTGGTGTCANVDPSRIKVTWVGTEQVADMQPGLCGTSARASAEERRGSAVSTADQNRRVEVWLVPKGTAMPQSFKEPKQLNSAALKKLGCPK